jgi:membrane fusion protein, copper/silver efflux system
MSRRLILAILLLAAGAGAAVVWRTSRTAPAAQGLAKATYQCSMHPQIVSDKPGNCPICGMTLTKVEHDEAAPKERKVAFYRHPMRPDVTSPEPAKDEMGMDYVPVYEDELGGEKGDVPGHAPFTLSSERQQLIGVTTERAEKRDLNVEIRTVGKVAYDPELYNAIAEHREAVAARRKLKDSPLAEAQERAEALVRSSMMRLRLMGISDEQIRDMGEQTPDPVNLLLPSKTAWVYAQVFEYEVDLLRPGQVVVVTAPSLPGQTFKGKITAVDSVLDATTRTARVRAEIATPQERFRPEMFVHVTILIPLGKKLAVPENAVLNTGEHKIIFVKQGEGRFEPRSVEVGRVAQGYQEVRSGLAEGEDVVTSANFLIDSESRFKSAVADFSRRDAPAPAK